MTAKPKRMLSDACRLDAHVSWPHLQQATAVGCGACDGHEGRADHRCAQENQAALSLLPIWICAPVDIPAALTGLMSHGLCCGLTDVRQRPLALAPLCVSDIQ